MLELNGAAESQIEELQAGITSCDLHRQEMFFILCQHRRVFDKHIEYYESRIQRGLNWANDVFSECERIGERLSRYVVDLVLEWKRNKKEDGLI